MSPTQAVREAKRTSAQGLRSPPLGVADHAGKCLLVAADEARLEGMRCAASAAGWDCFACDAPENSLRQAFLERYALAIVDIEPLRHRRLLKDLFRLLIESAGGLVIAYDQRGYAESELWARENGAWLYVPGVVDWEELSIACHEAKRIKERLGNRGALGAPA